MFGLGSKFIPAFIVLFVILAVGSFVAFKQSEPTQPIVKEELPQELTTTPTPGPSFPQEPAALPTGVPAQPPHQKLPLQKSQQEQISVLSNIPKLGNLCIGEDACKNFCLNNRGRCESFCQLNPSNQLCTKLFPSTPLINKQSTNVSSSVPNKRHCISNPSPLFTHIFTEVENLTGISQFGNNGFYNPGAQARSYVFVDKNKTVMLYAPVDATIVHLYYSDKNYSDFIRPEYRIDLQVSCEVYIAFDHIVNISDSLKPFAPQTSAPGRNPGVEVAIPVKAGDLLGTTPGTFRKEGGGGFDFLFTNKARNASRLNPARWTTENSRHFGCPYDYFTENLKQQYYALLVKENTESTCGPRVKEVLGTPQGYWFQGDATEEQGKRFVIYQSRHFVEWTPLIKAGETPIAYRTHDNVEIQLASITEGKSACYYDKEKDTHVFLKMLPNDQLSLASNSGPCPSYFPENYETWAR